MSRKGCRPDNARCEGFFGRLKTEFFYGCDWSKVTIEEFMGTLNAYLRWYRDVRIKSDLDYKSPMQYRRDMGLLAAEDGFGPRSPPQSSRGSFSLQFTVIVSDGMRCI